MSNPLICDVLSILLFPSPLYFLNSHGFGDVTYSNSKLLSENINTLEILQSDQLVTRLPPSAENKITVRRGHLSMSRVEFGHEIQFVKQSKSVWTSEGPFLN
jgi:hypothetical protein